MGNAVIDRTILYRARRRLRRQLLAASKVWSIEGFPLLEDHALSNEIARIKRQQHNNNKPNTAIGS